VRGQMQWSDSGIWLLRVIAIELAGMASNCKQSAAWPVRRPAPNLSVIEMRGRKEGRKEVRSGRTRKLARETCSRANIAVRGRPSYEEMELV